MILGAGCALPVFDCGSNKTQFKVIDLLQPEPCPDPIRDYQRPESVIVQVLQTDTDLPVKGYRCRVTISKKVSRCGVTSLSYGHSWPVWKNNVELTPAECRMAVKEGIIPVDNKRYKIEVGTTKDIRFYSKGSRDDAGNCEYASFYSGGVQFHKSYEETVLEALVEPIHGTADLSTNTLKFPNGLMANFKDQILRDDIEGMIVWDSTPPTCQETVSEVYYGKAEVHRKLDQRNKDAIIMIANEGSNQYAGLVLREAQSTCKTHCYSTQIRGLVVCLLRSQDEPLPRTSFKSHFDPKTTNLQTQLSYLHIGNNLRMYNRFEQVQADICKLDHRTLMSKLQAIAGASNPYSLLDLYGPGHTIYVSGAAAYIAKCPVVEATRTDYANCTEEIPVKVAGQIRFADPFTWVLKDFPTVSPCSDIMPIRWKITNEWYCATPNVHRCPAPERLNITMGHRRIDEPFLDGMGTGIYTENQLYQHRLYHQSKLSRTAALSKATNAATQSGFNGNLGRFMGDTEVTDLTREISYNVFPMMYFFGDAWHWVVGLLFLLSILKILIESIIRMYVVYKSRGLGPWVFWSICDTGFLIIATPWELIRQTAEKLLKTSDDDDQPRRPDAEGSSEERETSMSEMEEGERFTTRDIVMTFQDLRQQLAQLQRDMQAQQDPRPPNGLFNVEPDAPAERVARVGLDAETNALAQQLFGKDNPWKGMNRDRSK